ncbi:MAG: class I SAM-dependent methyltransferase [Burkholderiales bacterium]|nr:class I SAM-dependent methyltransferase [Burkholderiales bacterium]
MMHSFRGAASVLAISLGLVAGPATAQLFTEDQRPSACHKKYDDTGPGRDVIYVPTRLQTVERMLDFAEVKPGETLVDLGSGDGRIVLAAAKRGANARGIELDEGRFNIANCWAQEMGLTGKARFLQANIFEHNFTDAAVVTMYLLPGLNIKLRPIVLDMRPGTRVVSHAFTMGDWEADRTESVAGSNQTIYLWIVPAKVAGSWTLTPASGSPVTLSLTQTYQKFEGGNGTTKVAKGSLRGDQISFTLVENSGAARDFTGRVVGDRIEGKGWTAVRSK